MTSTLQAYLVDRFQKWSPDPPGVVAKTKSEITLCCLQNDSPFGFLDESGDLIYRIYRKNKLPPWILVYSGGKSTKTIDNLSSCYHYIFKLQIILKKEAVPKLCKKFSNFYGSKTAIIQSFENSTKGENEDITVHRKDEIATNENNGSGDGKYISTKVKNNSTSNIEINEEYKVTFQGAGDSNLLFEKEKCDTITELESTQEKAFNSWLCSCFSEETGVTTESAGSNPIAFCMAVRCGYIKRLQQMLLERPSLIGMMNLSTGQTPLTTAVRQGDINTVAFLLSSGADVNQPSLAGHAPLHLALLAGNVELARLLLDKRARVDLSDANGLRSEHYAADGDSVEGVRLVMSRGGDVHVRDNNGWTPLFRAVSQGASPEVIRELIELGSDVTVRDNAGLPLADAARILRDKRGQPVDTIIRLVDSSYPHEVALTHFTRLTKKISRMHGLFRN